MTSDQIKQLYKEYDPYGDELTAEEISWIRNQLANKPEYFSKSAQSVRPEDYDRFQKEDSQAWADQIMRSVVNGRGSQNRAQQADRNNIYLGNKDYTWGEYLDGTEAKEKAKGWLQRASAHVDAGNSPINAIYNVGIPTAIATGLVLNPIGTIGGIVGGSALSLGGDIALSKLLGRPTSVGNEISKHTGLSHPTSELLNPLMLFGAKGGFRIGNKATERIASRFGYNGTGNWFTNWLSGPYKGAGTVKYDPTRVSSGYSKRAGDPYDFSSLGEDAAYSDAFADKYHIPRWRSNPGETTDPTTLNVKWKEVVKPNGEHVWIVDTPTEAVVPVGAASTSRTSTGGVRILPPGPQYLRLLSGDAADIIVNNMGRALPAETAAVAGTTESAPVIHDALSVDNYQPFDWDAYEAEVANRAQSAPHSFDQDILYAEDDDLVFDEDGNLVLTPEEQEALANMNFDSDVWEPDPDVLSAEDFASNVTEEPTQILDQTDPGYSDALSEVIDGISQYIDEIKSVKPRILDQISDYNDFGPFILTPEGKISRPVWSDNSIPVDKYQSDYIQPLYEYISQFDQATRKQILSDEKISLDILADLCLQNPNDYNFIKDAKWAYDRRMGRQSNVVEFLKMVNSTSRARSLGLADPITYGRMNPYGRVWQKQSELYDELRDVRGKVQSLYQKRQNVGLTDEESEQLRVAEDRLHKLLDSDELKKISEGIKYDYTFMPIDDPGGVWNTKKGKTPTIYYDFLKQDYDVDYDGASPDKGYINHEAVFTSDASDVVGRRAKRLMDGTSFPGGYIREDNVSPYSHMMELRGAQAALKNGHPEIVQTFTDDQGNLLLQNLNHYSPSNHTEPNPKKHTAYVFNTLRKNVPAELRDFILKDILDIQGGLSKFNDIYSSQHYDISDYGSALTSDDKTYLTHIYDTFDTDALSVNPDGTFKDPKIQHIYKAEPKAITDLQKYFQYRDAVKKSIDHHNHIDFDPNSESYIFNSPNFKALEDKYPQIASEFKRSLQFKVSHNQNIDQHSAERFILELASQPSVRAAFVKTTYPSYLKLLGIDTEKLGLPYYDESRREQGLYTPLIHLQYKQGGKMNYADLF